MVGDAFHNFVDGAVIAAAVLTSVPLGISTAVAVAAHEIPQEVGDFAILLHAGYSRGKALWLNVLSALASALGAVARFFAFDMHSQASPVLPVAGGRQLSLRGDGRPDPGPAPRPHRCQLAAADYPHRAGIVTMTPAVVRPARRVVRVRWSSASRIRAKSTHGPERQTWQTPCL